MLFALVKRRFLNLHEYQSKAIMASYGIPIQKHVIIGNTNDIPSPLVLNGSQDNVVVKAQILSGGRGKGYFPDIDYRGGVHILPFKDKEGIKKSCSKMLGNRLVTEQNAPKGSIVRKVMIAEALDIQKEIYFAYLVDAKNRNLCMVGSPKGGMDIEMVAKEHPEQVFQIPIDINGPTREELEKMTFNLGLSNDLNIKEQTIDTMKKLFKMFRELDILQLEINPLGVTNKGKVLCFDAKLTFDDNSAFRHEEVFKMKDLEAEDAQELKASEIGVNYIRLDGDIGCMVNGAGLAMATMDLIGINGGKPANFLDVGGSVQGDQIEKAMKALLLEDPQVKGIFVNIFGGIVRCDVIAQGIIKGLESIKLAKPIVVRLEGTNADEGAKIIKKANSSMIFGCNDFDTACKMIIHKTRENQLSINK